MTLARSVWPSVTPHTAFFLVLSTTTLPICKMQCVQHILFWILFCNSALITEASFSLSVFFLYLPFCCSLGFLPSSEKQVMEWTWLKTPHWVVSEGYPNFLCFFALSSSEAGVPLAFLCYLPRAGKLWAEGAYLVLPDKDRDGCRAEGGNSLPWWVWVFCLCVWNRYTMWITVLTLPFIES